MDDIFAFLFCCLICCDEDSPNNNNNIDNIYYNKINNTKIKRN